MNALATCTAVGMLLLSSAARADYFQVFGSHGYIALSRIEVEGRVYYTDGYGRIELRLPAGDHSGQITMHGATSNIAFHVDGTDRLKPLRVP